MRILNDFVESPIKNISNNYLENDSKSAKEQQFNDVIEVNNHDYIGSIVKAINVSEKEQVHFLFSKETQKLSINFINKNGQVYKIKDDNLPKDIYKINNLEILDKFLANASIKVVMLSDNEPKLYISQKLLGGMNNGINPVGSIDVQGKKGNNVNVQTTVGVSVNPTPSTTVQATVSHATNINSHGSKISKPTFGLGFKYHF